MERGSKREVGRHSSLLRSLYCDCEGEKIKSWEGRAGRRGNGGERQGGIDGGLLVGQSCIDFAPLHLPRLFQVVRRLIRQGQGFAPPSLRNGILRATFQSHGTRFRAVSPREAVAFGANGVLIFCDWHHCHDAIPSPENASTAKSVSRQGTQHGLGGGRRHSMLQQLPVCSASRRLEELWDPLLEQGLAGNQRHEPEQIRLRSIHRRPMEGGRGGTATAERVALPLPILLGPFYLPRVLHSKMTHTPCCVSRPQWKLLLGSGGGFGLGACQIHLDGPHPPGSWFVGYKRKKDGTQSGRMLELWSLKLWPFPASCHPPSFKAPGQLF